MEGKTLSHYRILEKLGAGRLGEVYLAEDTRLGRRVILKMLREELFGGTGRLERFQREARSVAALNHPGIQALYSVEEIGGRLLVVSQLIEGRSLSDAIPSEGLDAEQLLEIALELTEAVAAAHERGVVHRDIKPSNVMLTSGGRVKVLDFGLAKVAQEAASATLTSEGLSLESVRYMSPEQIRAEPVDPRSDVFALGLLLYEMAAGRAAFAGGTAIEVLFAILRDSPAPLAELSKELPQQLVRIIEKCLEKAPNRRFQTARELSQALLDLRPSPQLESRPLASSPMSRVEVLSLPWSLPWWLVPSLVGAALILVIVAGRETLPSLPRSPVRSVAILPFENLGKPDDSVFARGAAEEITSRLAHTEGLEVHSWTSAVELPATSRWRGLLVRPLGVEYVVKGTIERQTPADGAPRVFITPRLVRLADDAEVWSNTYDSSFEDVLDVQAEIARRVARELESEPAHSEGPQRPRFTEHDGFYLTQIFYATDRAHDPELGFTGKRGGEELTYGVVEVSIPGSHEPGLLESPRWFWQRADPAEHVVVVSVDLYDGRQTFVTEIRSLLEEVGRDDVLVFLHGFRVPFEEAARRTAQLAWDLKFTGAPIFYSWPAVGETEHYLTDESTVEWTTPHFQEFLRLVVGDLGARRAHVIAHSMGNRALVEALSKFDPGSLPDGAAKLRQIILAAPDIDADVFRQLSANFPGKADRITLYTSRNDRAIQASKKFHTYPRAGGELVIVDHVDTIDASRVESGILNHSYFSDVVVSDIFALIKNDLPPGLRFGLAERTSDAGRYWEFLPGGRPRLTWKGWALVLGLVALVIALALLLWRRRSPRLF